MKQTVIKLTRGVPPPECFPKEQLAEIAPEVLLEFGDVALQYGPAYGFQPLRELIAAENQVGVENVLLGQGSLQIVDLFTRMTIRPGDVVFVESPTYDRTLTVLRRARANVIGFPLEDDGPNPDEIEARLKQGERPAFFYIIPDFQNPSGVVTSAEKRKRIAALAEEYGFLVVEDVPYRRLRYRNAEPVSFYELSPQATLQLSSYSKLIAPGLRVGSLLGPAEIVRKLAKYAEDTYINTSYFNQAIVYAYTRRGWLDTHLEELKRLYCSRLDTTLSALERRFASMATWRKPDGGFFVGMTLNTSACVEDLCKHSPDFGLELSNGRGFFPNGDGDHFVRLPFCALKPEEIEEGIERLSRLVSSLG